MQAAKEASALSAGGDKQQAAKLRMGAHLALALCYLPVEVPGPQDTLHIRPPDDVDDDSQDQDWSKSDELPLQVRPCPAVGQAAEVNHASVSQCLVAAVGCLHLLLYKCTLFALVSFPSSKG